MGSGQESLKQTGASALAYIQAMLLNNLLANSKCNFHKHIIALTTWKHSGKVWQSFGVIRNENKSYTQFHVDARLQYA